MNEIFLVRQHPFSQVQLADLAGDDVTVTRGAGGAERTGDDLLLSLVQQAVDHGGKVLF